MRKNARRLNLSFDNLDIRAVPSSVLAGSVPDVTPTTELGGTSGGGGGMHSQTKVYGSSSGGSSGTTSS